MGSPTSPDQDEQEERPPNSPLEGPELLISAAEHARGQASFGRDVDNDLQESPPHEPQDDGSGSPATVQAMVPEPSGRSKRSAAVAAVAAAAAAVAAAAAEAAAESEDLEEKPQPTKPDPPQPQPQQQQQPPQQQQALEEDQEQEQEQQQQQQQQAAAQGGSSGGGVDAGISMKSRGGPKPKLPRPEGVQPCPRCESQDTKFCYYNNYNIKQPRYFCRACQRYWTAGGALRDVPVGAGRRKSKASKPDGMPSPALGAGSMLPPQPPDPTALVANIMASMPEAMLSQMQPLGGLAGPLDPAGAALAAYRQQLPGGDDPKKRTMAMLQGMPPGMQPLPGGMPPQMGDAGLAVAGGMGMIPPDLGGPGAKLPVGGPLGMAGSALLGGREAGGDVGPDAVSGLMGGPKVPNGLGAMLPGAGLAGAGSSLPLSEDDGSVDGRRTRMKVGGGGSMSSGSGAAGGMGAAGMLPPGGLSALASAAGGAAGAVGLLAAATGSRGSAPGLASPQSASFVPPAPAAGGLFGGTARYGADGGLGAAHHLGTAGPLSSEFFAMPAAHAPHMQQQQVAAAAMHAQLLQLHAGAAAAPHMAAPYGIGGMWPYGGLASFGGAQAPWPGAHPAAAASLARYPAAGFGGLPPAAAAAGAAPGLGLGLGGPLGAGPHPASSMLSTVDMAQALAQVPPSCGPAAIVPTQLPGWPGRLGAELGGPAASWGAVPGMGGALGHSPLAASVLPHHPPGMGGPLGPPPGLPGEFGGLGMSMVPTSAAPSSSLMAAAAAASGLGPPEDAGVPA